ncbi:MAG: FAD-dependent oxidoreductase [Patescibacteria group bacterium]|nr:FAD-dependent oxidoreductase [Patescibacteria group bacterium]
MLLTFIRKYKEADDVFSFFFKSNKPLIWRAGQYLFYTFPNNHPDDRGVTRYFTISSAMFEKHVSITTRISKPSSTFKKDLLGMKKGDTIQASGPDGDFTIDDLNKNYVFIAGGIGITPFRSILLDLDYRQKPINVQLLYSNRNEDVVFKKELESLAQGNPNFKIKYFISPQRIDEKAIQSQRPTANDQKPIFYVSGPEPFVESIEKILKDLEVKSQNIKLDHFPGYPDR